VAVPCATHLKPDRHRRRERAAATAPRRR
jgi:hypothetical protein